MAAVTTPNYLDNFDTSQNANTPLVVITGETASGKSELAMRVAKNLNGELICADSWTVYKGFDIGTAKPSKKDQSEIPHHLIDVADPRIGFNAALFQRMAQQLISDIAKKGKLPILVGGTGLYIDSILFDYSFLPPSTTTAQREQLNKLSLEELIKETKKRNLNTQDIDMRNKRRIIRLIENDGRRPSKKQLRSNTVIIGMRLPLGELRERIIRRIDAMVEAGFVEEVRTLGSQYGWGCEPMRAPGYRAFADYIAGSITLEQAKERFRQNDLKLAKKQRTWFKRNKSIQWFSSADEAYAYIGSIKNYLIHKQ